MKWQCSLSTQRSSLTQFKHIRRLANYGDLSAIGSVVGTVSVGGYSWTLWAGYNGAMKTFSFVASSPIPSFSSDVKEFFSYLASNQGYPASSQYLLSESSPLHGIPNSFMIRVYGG